MNCPIPTRFDLTEDMEWVSAFRPSRLGWQAGLSLYSVNSEEREPRMQTSAGHQSREEEQGDTGRQPSTGGRERPAECGGKECEAAKKLNRDWERLFWILMFGGVAGFAWLYLSQASSTSSHGAWLGFYYGLLFAGVMGFTIRWSGW